MIQSVYRLLGKQVELERRCSMPALSLSRQDTRICNSIIESARFRNGTSPISPKLEARQSVIFNVRAYYGCYNLDVPKCMGTGSGSSRGSNISENDVSERHANGAQDINGNKVSDIDGNINGSLLETEMRDDTSI